MKKILVLAVFLFFAGMAQAQLSGLANTAKALGFDVNKLTTSIMSKLVPKLGLTTAQKPKVTDAVTDYLEDKAGIVGEQASKPAEYAKKQSGFFKTLLNSLTGILAKDQLNKFLGLKPATNDPTNVLSQLFY
jgi:hypothetical protein